MKRKQAVDGLKRGKGAGIFPVRTVKTALDAPVKKLFSASWREAPLWPDQVGYF
ncbi:MAG: hypothetical protein GXY86_12400 [Firmicutes bacterium]|nr:hypothetical protein [Bacillota bacterium]